MSTLRKAAEEIIGNMKRAYTAPYTIVPADEQAFSHLDLSVYRRFKETLEGDGFRFISDYEILEVNNSPSSLLARTMIRCMLSADGGTSASYYQIRPRIGRLVTNLLVGIVNLRFMAAPSFFLENARTKHYYDFESEIAGAYVTTSNAAGAAAMSLLHTPPRQMSGPLPITAATARPSAAPANAPAVMFVALNTRLSLTSRRRAESASTFECLRKKPLPSVTTSVSPRNSLNLPTTLRLGVVHTRTRDPIGQFVTESTWAFSWEVMTSATVAAAM